MTALGGIASGSESLGHASTWKSIQRLQWVGASVAAALVLGAGGWAALTPLAGAIVASGTMVVEGNVKRVQHPTGGIVEAIHVRNGQAVTKGEVILRFDDAQTRAALGAVVSQIVQMSGRKARLEAERDQHRTITFPTGFETSDPSAPGVRSGEVRLFELRRDARVGQQNQLRERVQQLQSELDGTQGQRQAKSAELLLMREELSRVAALRERDLTNLTRYTSSKRDLVKLEGEQHQLSANVARLAGQIAEVNLQILSIDQQTQSDATRELRDLEARLAELQERRWGLDDQLRRIEVRAPQTGIIHDLTVHTVGGVVNPAETMMVVVPVADRLLIETRIATTDINQIVVGQAATVKFSLSNLRLTPEVPARITFVGSDLTKDAQAGTSFFVVRAEVPDAELVKLGGFKPSPGYPAEVFITTDDRTVLQSLLKPFLDFTARAGR